MTSFILALVGGLGLQSSGGIEQVAWLQGCWESTERSGSIVEEQWMVPRGGTTLGMGAKTIGPDTVMFENLEHDFPQRVGYRRAGSALTAWIEGTQDGNIRRIDFSYHR